MSVGNEQTKLLFSMISGYNFYKVITTDGNRIEAKHYKDDIDVDIRIITSNILDAKLWKEYISCPPNTDLFLWPIDIVYIKDTSFSRIGNIGLVFKKRGFPKLEFLKNTIYNDSVLDWRNKEIQILTVNILNSLNELYDRSYAFIAFNPEQILFERDSKRLLYNFSTSVIKISSNDLKKKYRFISNDISIDFSAPWINHKDISEATLQMSYYSITALLFRLLIGRMPYQGSLLDGCGDLMDYRRDVDNDAHIVMMEKYKSLPVFIFSPIDDSNSIGAFLNEEKFIDRWEALDSNVQKMFIDSFTHDEKTKMSKKLYSPSQWSEALENCFRR